ncbi:hypothetical protein Pmani_016623 [Petrolisthes manimaculis]|uniref:RING-type domain-containing protein n=1 Tax=Petrolisthes manimaculis TaxID=1843537 RepID=A0AAE1U6I4_9EUCA|nr:hypothetical protein Pmani_016623 [Petrolisthes manimaculis]
MMDVGSLGCEVCFIQFDEKNHKPRVLPCGHTLCDTCTHDILNRTQIVCPFCRVNHQVSSSEDLPVSFTLLNLATTSSSSSSSLPFNSNHISRRVISPTSLPVTVMEPSIHDGLCEMHGSYKIFQCITCNVWVCRDCTVVEHSPSKCTLMEVQEALDNMKKTQQIQINNLKLNCTKHLTLLDSYHVKLGQQRDQQQSNLPKLQEVNKAPESCIKALKEEQQRVNKRLYDGQRILTEMDASLSQLMGFNTINTLTRGCQYLQRKVEELETWLLTSKQMLRDSSTDIQADKEQEKVDLILQVMKCPSNHPLGPGAQLFIHINKNVNEKVTKENLLALTRRGNNVWAVKGGGEESAPVTLQDGTLHLHTLRKIKIPSDALVVPYDCVKQLVKQNSAGVPTKTFLDLQWGEQQATGGRVYVTLDEDSGMGFVYAVMCSGEGGGGKSYRNTRLHSVLNRGKTDHERVVGGTEHINDPVIEMEIGPRRNITLGKDKVSLGTVRGNPVFLLWHSSSPWNGMSSFVVIGTLSGGTDIVRQAAMHNPVTKVLVSDCGLVL